eukprot:PhF_6_TR39050/c0_g1_i2/m.58441
MFTILLILVSMVATNTFAQSTGTCMKSCFADSDCGVKGVDECWSCKGAASGKVKGTCTAYKNDTCGKLCANNNDCGLPMDNETCSFCSPNGRCVQGGACGAQCSGNDMDCDQTSRCNRCVNVSSSTVGTKWICSAGCQQPCDEDSQCLSTNSMCTTCIMKNMEYQKTCQHFNCGQPCKKAADCAGITAGLCTQCDLHAGV